MEINAQNNYCVRCLESLTPALGKLIGDDDNICIVCENYAKYAHDKISGHALLGFQELLSKDQEEASKS